MCSHTSQWFVRNKFPWTFLRMWIARKMFKKFDDAFCRFHCFKAKDVLECTFAWRFRKILQHGHLLHSTKQMPIIELSTSIKLMWKYLKLGSNGKLQTSWFIGENIWKFCILSRITVTLPTFCFLQTSQYVPEILENYLLLSEIWDTATLMLRHCDKNNVAFVTTPRARHNIRNLHVTVLSHQQTCFTKLCVFSLNSHRYNIFGFMLCFILKTIGENLWGPR